MSGSNTNMSRVTNVISSLDGTDVTLTPFNWTCPEVDPYSTVYFYQVRRISHFVHTMADALKFTNGGQVGQVSWTTRFTVCVSQILCLDDLSQPISDRVAQWRVC